MISKPTTKQLLELAGVDTTQGQAKLLIEKEEADAEEKEATEKATYKPKKGFLLDKPVKRKEKKSEALKKIEKQVKANAKKAMTMKEFFSAAGIDSTKGKAKAIVEADESL